MEYASKPETMQKDMYERLNELGPPSNYKYRQMISMFKKDDDPQVRAEASSGSFEQGEMI